MTIRNILKKIIKYRQFKNKMRNSTEKFKAWFVSIDEYELYTISSLIGLCIGITIMFLISR